MNVTVTWCQWRRMQCIFEMTSNRPEMLNLNNIFSLMYIEQYVVHTFVTLCCVFVFFISIFAILQFGDLQTPSLESVWQSSISNFHSPFVSWRQFQLQDPFVSMKSLSCFWKWTCGRLVLLTYLLNARYYLPYMSTIMTLDWLQSVFDTVHHLVDELLWHWRLRVWKCPFANRFYTRMHH